MTRFACAAWLTTAILASACTADPSDGTTDPGPGADAGAIDDPGDDIGGPVELSVDDVPPSTFWGSLPISGKGPAHGTLLYTTPAGGQYAEDLGADGRFCIDVRLMEGAVNNIKLEAVNPNGDYSDPAVLQVRQDGTPPDPGPDPEPTQGYENLAKDTTVFDGNVSFDEGAFAVLFDGDTSTPVDMRNSATPFWSDYMNFDLTEPGQISQIRIRTTDDCPIGEAAIYLSNQESEAHLHEWSWLAGLSVLTEEWTWVGTITDGTSDNVVVPNLGNPTARRVGIEFRSRDCGPLVGTGRHKITEIEVYAATDGEEPDEEPSDGSPSCSSGG